MTTPARWRRSRSTRQPEGGPGGQPDGVTTSSTAGRPGAPVAGFVWGLVTAPVVGEVLGLVVELVAITLDDKPANQNVDVANAGEVHLSPNVEAGSCQCRPRQRLDERLRPLIDAERKPVSKRDSGVRQDSQVVTPNYAGGDSGIGGRNKMHGFEAARQVRKRRDRVREQPP